MPEIVAILDEKPRLYKTSLHCKLRSNDGQTKSLWMPQNFVCLNIGPQETAAQCLNEALPRERGFQTLSGRACGRLSSSSAEKRQTGDPAVSKRYKENNPTILSYLQTLWGTIGCAGITLPPKFVNVYLIGKRFIKTLIHLPRKHPPVSGGRL